MKKLLSALTVLVIAVLLVSCGPKTPKKYQVTFDSVGGTVVPTKIVEHGEKVIKPNPDPTKDGFKFQFWMEGTEEFDFNTAIKKDTNLVANWKEDGQVVVEKVTVTFKDGNNTNVPAPQEIEKGKKATAPTTNPTKDGFIFKGWALEATPTVLFNFNDAVTTNITLVPIWEVAAEAELFREFTFGPYDGSGTGYKEENLVWTETFGEVTASKNRVQINKSSFNPHDNLGMLVFAPIDTATKAHIDFDFTTEAYVGLNKIEFELSAWNNTQVSKITNDLENARFTIEVKVGDEWVSIKTVILKDLLVADTYQTVSVPLTTGQGIYRISYIAEDAKPKNTTQAVTLDNLKLFK